MRSMSHVPMLILRERITSGLNLAKLETSDSNLSQGLATALPSATSCKNHKVVVVGGGSAGIALSHQLIYKGNFVKDDIALVDPVRWHHYQSDWTLVGGGSKGKNEFRRPLSKLIEPEVKFYNRSVTAIDPEGKYLLLGNGDTINYEQLVVAPGVKIDYDSITGLSEAMADPDSLVASIYSYYYCDKVFRNMKRMD